MSILLSLAILFSTVPSQARSTDWRTDHEAFRSYRSPGKRILDFNPPKRILEVYDSVYLKRRLQEFSGAIPVVIQGKESRIQERESAAGKLLARVYLRELLTKMGYKVSEQKYSQSGINLIAEREGRNPDRVVIVSAHLDNVGNAGADDDGSGVISALSIMAALSNVELKNTLRFVAFDQEELGLYGSKAYAKKLDTNRESILGVFNLEMTAYNKRKDGAFHVIDCDRKDSIGLTRSVIQAVSDLGLPLQRTKACTDRSDHASFWDVDVPAVVISQNFFGGDSNPCYHEKCDQVSSALNFEYMSNITESVGLAIKRMVAESPKRRR